MFQHTATGAITEDDECGLPGLLDAGEREEGVEMDTTKALGDVEVSADALPAVEDALCEGMEAGVGLAEGFPRFLPCAIPRYISYCFTASGSSGKGYSAPRRSAAAMPAGVPYHQGVASARVLPASYVADKIYVVHLLAVCWSLRQDTYVCTGI